MRRRSDLTSVATLRIRRAAEMTEPDDYELAGSVVRFAPAQIPDAGDIVNILYEVAP